MFFFDVFYFCVSQKAGIRLYREFELEHIWDNWYMDPHG